MAIPFCKFHGFGNDYIVIERAAVPAEMSLHELARAICERNRGAGSDGIAVLDPSDDADSDYFCEIINPDAALQDFSNGTAAPPAIFSKRERACRAAERSGLKRRLIEERRERIWFEGQIGGPLASTDVPSQR